MTGHESNILIPCNLGLGCSKLRHKLAALLHQLKLEVGSSPKTLRKYCSFVIGFVTDQGVEASLVDAPNFELGEYLKQEAEALGSSVTVELGNACLEDEVLYPLQMPQEAVDRRAGGDEAGRERQRAELNANTSLVCRLFPNCLFVPGLKHSMDNVLHDVWGSMGSKDTFLSQLRAIESVVKPPSVRDKLIHLFFASEDPLDKVMSDHLRSWRSGLASLRWHAVIDFAKELKQIQPGLRQRWDLQRFISALPREQHGTPAEGRGASPAVTYKTVDTAVHSGYFWAFCDLLLEVSSAAETLSRWAESCWWHGSACRERDCAFKGCKAPELAAGIHRYLLKERQAHANVKIAQLAPGLPSRDASALLSQWHAAHARLELEFEYKLHFWQLLPWKLAGLACNSLPVARALGKECLSIWGRMSSSERRTCHPMTRRFLDAEWKGLRTAPVLR